MSMIRGGVKKFTCTQGNAPAHVEAGAEKRIDVTLNATMRLASSPGPVPLDYSPWSILDSGV